MRERKRLRQHPVLTGALGMALGLAVVLSSPGRLEALEKVIITQAVESLAFVANYVARANGYFTDENLAVEVISTRGGGPDCRPQRR